MFSPDGRGTRCTNTPSEATFSRLRSTICSGHCCQPILSENTYRHIYISIYTTKLSMKLYIIDNKSPSSTFVGMGPTVVILYNTVYSLYTFFFLFPGKKKTNSYTHCWQRTRSRPTLSSNIRLGFLTFHLHNNILLCIHFIQKKSCVWLVYICKIHSGAVVCIFHLHISCA